MGVQHFTENQLRAIRHLRGPALVLAGPGSGKTTVLTERIKYMVEQEHIPPESILVITFTRAAAEEMELRFHKKSKGRVRFGTFHSIFFSILRETYHYQAKNIIEDEEKLRLLKQIAKDLRIELPKEQLFFSRFLSELSRYKSLQERELQKRGLREKGENGAKGDGKEGNENEKHRKEKYGEEKYGKEEHRIEEHGIIFGEVSERWGEGENKDEKKDVKNGANKRKRKGLRERLRTFILSIFFGNGKSGFRCQCMETECFLRLAEELKSRMEREHYLDFDDILTVCRERLWEDAETLHRLQDAYPYILVDEFQDVSPIQYEVLKMLASPRNNLFIVGDDDQSIYAFRGAEPQIMLDFPKDFPGAVRIDLSENFRSNTEIVAFAALLIGENRIRFPKNIHAVKGTGGQVRLYRCPDVEKEYRLLGKKIREELREGQKASEIAVLFRTNQQRERILRALSAEGIPCSLPEQELEKREGSGVCLMTYHGSKGLEFDTVHLPNLVEGITPYGRAKGKRALEEERRCFYVAVTRARKRLFLYTVEKRYGKSCEASRFIEDGLGDDGRSFPLH